MTPAHCSTSSPDGNILDFEIPSEEDFAESAKMLPPRGFVRPLAGWADEDIAVIRDTAARVLKTAHTIAEIIEQHD